MMYTPSVYATCVVYCSPAKAARVASTKSDATLLFFVYIFCYDVRDRFLLVMVYGERF